MGAVEHTGHLPFSYLCSYECATTFLDCRHGRLTEDRGLPLYAGVAFGSLLFLPLTLTVFYFIFLFYFYPRVSSYKM